MGRSFTKNLSNRMTLGLGAIGPKLHGAAQVSVMARVYSRSRTNAVNADRIINIYVGNNVAGLVLGINATGASGRVYVGGRSRTADAFQSRVGSTYNASPNTQFHALGGVLDFTAKTITPYAGGVADNAGSATFGVNTFTYTATPTNVDAIGASGELADANSQTDGILADLAIWRGALTADDAIAYAAGISGDQIRPEILAAYYRLDGINSPEQDTWGDTRGTIAGSVPAADGPPLFLTADMLDLIPLASSPPTSTLFRRGRGRRTASRGVA